LATAWQQLLAGKELGRLQGSSCLPARNSTRGYCNSVRRHGCHCSSGASVRPAESKSCEDTEPSGLSIKTQTESRARVARTRRSLNAQRRQRLPSDPEALEAAALRERRSARRPTGALCIVWGMTPEVFVDAVKKKVEILQRVGFWPPDAVHAGAWLGNFEKGEELPAAVILDNLSFYSNRNTNALLRATFQNLRDELSAGGDAGLLDQLVFTPLEDEKPNPSDSGKLFCRKARQILSIPEERMLEPASALERAISGAPIVFLDDFLGSAEQLIKTWKRAYRTDAPRTFAEAHAAKPFRVIYLVLVATAFGLKRARFECPAVDTWPAHILGEEYSIRNVAQLPHAPPFPGLAHQIHNLLSKYSPRLKLKPYMNQSDFRVYGFYSRGLLVAFQHGCPDASLPIIFAGGTGSEPWSRLITPT